MTSDRNDPKLLAKAFCNPHKPNGIYSSIEPIEILPISSLSLPKHVLRKYSDTHKRQFARCLETFGFVTPIAIDAQGKVVAGAIWYLGAVQLRLPEVPTNRVTHLPPEYIEAFRAMRAENSVGNAIASSNEFVCGIAFAACPELESAFLAKITTRSRADWRRKRKTAFRAYSGRSGMKAPCSSSARPRGANARWRARSAPEITSLLCCAYAA